VTRRSIIEYAEALKGHYFRASKEEKGKMRDEFIRVTNMHCKAAIRLLHRTSQSGKKRWGCLRQYGAEDNPYASLHPGGQ